MSLCLLCPLFSYSLSHPRPLISTMKRSLVQEVRSRLQHCSHSRYHSSPSACLQQHCQRRATFKSAPILQFTVLHSHADYHRLSSYSHRALSTTADSPSIVLAPTLSGSHPPGSPLDKYVIELKEGRLRPDIRQETTMRKLQQLWEQIEHYLPATASAQPSSTAPVRQSSDESESSSSGGGFFSFAKRLGGMFSSHSSHDTPSAEPSSSSSSDVPRGLYLYGGVGCGKTRLMDLFYSCVSSPLKRRDHFHHFMLDFHAHLHKLRSSSSAPSTNPIPVIAKQYAARYKLLCLDEFQVTDVADAMILRLLFRSMWEEGVVVVATSNRPPNDLYKNGINRDVFVPFIVELQQQCNVHAMEDGQDHRLLGTLDDGVYHYPLDKAADERLTAIWQRLTEGGEVKPERVTVMMGRTINVQHAAKQAALFDFGELCDRALGAADYIALAQRYQYIVVRNVPVMRGDQREIIRRFITLLDVLYERGTRLIVSAAAKPRELFRDEDGNVVAAGGVGFVYDEGFASGRAVSRLIEMQSAEYVKRQIGGIEDGTVGT